MLDGSFRARRGIMKSVVFLFLLIVGPQHVLSEHEIEYILTGATDINEASTIVTNSQYYMIAASGSRDGAGMEFYYIEKEQKHIREAPKTWHCPACLDPGTPACSSSLCGKWPDWWSWYGEGNGAVEAPCFASDTADTVFGRLYYGYTMYNGSTRVDCIGKATSHGYEANLSWVDSGRPYACSVEGTGQPIARHPSIVTDNRGNPFLAYGVGSIFVLDMNETNFPENETQHASSFEDYSSDADVSGDGLWQTGVNGTAFQVGKGSTFTRSTGPSSASHGSYYAYVEATGNKGGKAFDLQTYDVGDISAITFTYHMYGETIGTVSLQGSRDSSTWTSLWTKSGNLGDMWSYAKVTVGAKKDYHFLRFYYVTGDSFTGDFALDNVLVSAKGTRTVVDPFHRHNNSVLVAKDDSCALEAPFIYRHERLFAKDLYYLFVVCPQTGFPHVKVGVSRNATGPFLDKKGRNMTEGGGEVFLGNRLHYEIPSQPGVFFFNETYEPERSDAGNTTNYVFTFNFDSTITNDSFTGWYFDWAYSDKDMELIREVNEYRISIVRYFLIRNGLSRGGTFPEQRQRLVDFYLADFIPWPVLTNVSWNPAAFVPPPPTVVVVPWWVWLLVGIFSCCCSATCCIGLSVWFDKDEPHKKAYEAFRLFMFNRCGDRIFESCKCLMLWTINRDDYLRSKYEDPLGRVRALFEELQITPSEEIRWLKLWEKIDTDMSNSMDFDEFCAYFQKLELSKIWRKRLFDLFNPNFNGVINFHDFLKSVYEICVLDTHLSFVFLFRILSRRGFLMDLQHDVIQEKDIYDFALERYGTPGLKADPKLKSLSNKIFDYMDDDESGGISLSELMGFTQRNKTLMLFTYHIQTKMRHHLFGHRYWVEMTARRSGEFIHNKFLTKALEQLALQERNDPLPPRYYVDFKDVYEGRQEAKVRRAKERYDRHTKKTREAKDSYLRICNVFSTLCQPSCTLTGAFYKWKRFAGFEVVEPASPSRMAGEFELRAGESVLTYETIGECPLFSFCTKAVNCLETEETSKEILKGSVVIVPQDEAADRVKEITSAGATALIVLYTSVEEIAGSEDYKAVRSIRIPVLLVGLENADLLGNGVLVELKEQTIHELIVAQTNALTMPSDDVMVDYGSHWEGKMLVSPENFQGAADHDPSDYYERKRSTMTSFWRKTPVSPMDTSPSPGFDGRRSAASRSSRGTPAGDIMGGFKLLFASDSTRPSSQNSDSGWNSSRLSSPFSSRMGSPFGRPSSQSRNGSAPQSRQGSAGFGSMWNFSGSRDSRSRARSSRGAAIIKPTQQYDAFEVL